jgi:hypothetical protein
MHRARGAPVRVRQFTLPGSRLRTFPPLELSHAIDIFSKSYDENQIWSKWSGRAAAARGSDAQISGAIQLPYKSVFVTTFRENVPRT